MEVMSSSPDHSYSGGCPTYTLNYCLQNGQKLHKWEPRARRSVFLSISKRHSLNVLQVLHLSTGAISPQYHVVFDDYFQTMSSTEVDVPQSWENLFTYSTQRWFEEDVFNEEVANRLDVLLENCMKISENKKSSVQSQHGSKPTKSGVKKSPVSGHTNDSREDTDTQMEKWRTVSRSNKSPV